MKLEVSDSARWIEKTTSSAVKGAPSWKVTFWRSLKRVTVGLRFSHESARQGSTFSSLPRVTSVS